ncbi:MAG: alpha/beta hydrolase-fold protein [Polyangiaceae bacterium]
MPSRRRIRRRLSAAAFGVAALCAFPERASAEVRLCPAADGSLGAWLLAGPVPSATAKRLEPKLFFPKESGELGKGLSTRWRTVSYTDTLDIAKVIPGRGNFAALGGWLDVSETSDAYLLLGVDGGVSVWLDGARIHERPAPALRAGAFVPIPMHLEPGRHRLVLWLESSLPDWGFWGRVVSQSDGLPPPGLSFALPETDESDSTTLGRDLLTVDLRPGVSATGYAPRLEFNFPRGFPAELLRGGEASPAVRLSAPDTEGKPRSSELAVGQLSCGTRGVGGYHVQLPALPASAGGALRVETKLPFSSQKLETKLDPAVPQALAAAAEQLKALEGRSEAAPKAPDASVPTFVDPDVIASSLRHASQTLRQQVEARDARGVLEAKRRLESLLDDLGDGVDPLDEAGVHSLALRSDLDGSDQPFALQLPSGYAKRKAKTRYPLVLLLHGYNGTPESVMRAFLDSSGDEPRVPGIVIAPYAHGNAFYREAGEVATLAALRWAMKTLAVDLERVSVTGVSMGGTGTGYMAVRYPELFSAASPLCGYHSYFVRRDTSKRPIRPWESARMHHWSPASWAENLRHVPMFVAQGTKDFPHDNSKVLIRRLRDLHYDVIEEWPETGHSVWTEVWDGADGWPWLSGKRRVEAPSEVRFVTDQLRYGAHYWLEVTRLQTPGKLAEVKAQASAGKVQLELSGVREMRFVGALPKGVKSPVSVKIGEQTLSVKADQQALRKSGDDWEVVDQEAPPKGHKRAGVEGPIRDVFMGPVTFVYGTRRQETSRATWELARAWAGGRGSATLSYPVVADRDLPEADFSANNLFLIGGARDNLVSARLGVKSRTETGGLELGELRFPGADVGCLYVMPNPASPERYLLVADAVTAQGYYLTDALPALLPDFLVFDQGVVPAAGQQVLSDGHVLAGGFFDWDWSLPKTTQDPEAKQR